MLADTFDSTKLHRALAAHDLASHRLGQRRDQMVGQQRCRARQFLRPMQPDFRARQRRQRASCCDASRAGAALAGAIDEIAKPATKSNEAFTAMSGDGTCPFRNVR